MSNAEACKGPPEDRLIFPKWVYPLYAGSGFPQQVQRRCSKQGIDRALSIQLLFSASYIGSKRNGAVLGDSFSPENVSSVPYSRLPNCCLIVQVGATQSKRTGAASNQMGKNEQQWVSRAKE